MTKKLWLLGGFILLGLSIVGILLPLLPAFPFVIGCAYCFSKSSNKWYIWLINQNWYQQTILPIRRKEGISIKRKIYLCLSVSFVFASSLWFLRNSFILVKGLIVTLWIGHLYYFIFKVKIKKQNYLSNSVNS